MVPPELHVTVVMGYPPGKPKSNSTRSHRIQIEVLNIPSTEKLNPGCLNLILGPEKSLLLETPDHSPKDDGPYDYNSDCHDACKDVQAITVKDISHDTSGRHLQKKGGEG